MKRTPLKRGKPLKASKGLKRATKPLKRNAPLKAKGGRRFKKNADPAYLAWIRTQPCAAWTMARLGGPLCPIRFQFRYCTGRVEAAHVKSRGAGGGDFGNVLPICAGEHARQHNIGIASWAASYGLTLDDLHTLAQSYATRYTEEPTR